MGLTYHHDEGAAGRSPMLRQLVLCNGQQKGFECKHYWRQVVRKDVLNPDALRKGETFRYCKQAMNAPDHNMAMFINGDAEMAVECTEYTPDHSRRYDPKVDAYDPLTPEEIKALQDGKAIARFKPRRWWEFWKPVPKVRIDWLTPEEIAAEAQAALERQTKTVANDDGILKGNVLDPSAQALAADASAASDIVPVSTDDKGVPQ